VDAGPDLRAQLLAAGVDRLSGVFLTHFHSDHVMGLDDLRAVTDRMEHPLPVWAPRRDADALRTSFPHLSASARGRGATAFLDLRPVADRETVTVGADSVRALEVPHGRGWSTGWVFGRRLAYFTDLSEMPPDVRAEVRGVEVLVLDMLREEPHPTHLDLARSLEIVRDCTPGKTFFIHMSHEVDHATTAAKLPEGIASRDG
jgi:phosphoribosyl 1,2-cyclic phosphate phosphodiesterase